MRNITNITGNDIQSLAEAYGASTPARNLFEGAFYFVAALRQADVFEADGETYAVFGNAIVTAQSLDPFGCDHAPEVTFLNGTGATFELGSMARVA